ncbi:hypothetical protein PRUPE_3G138100 [Prunus persica]|uniref:Uncharacterized protein n=1 Tax=Prunus persica TaxID=3760 RepID=M5VGK4_PRUPE|nr:hypothetical protein PRUPE_3G138100 [Prunus persica]
MDESLSHNDEAHASSLHSGRRRGGWITFPFITGALVGLTLTAGGWLSNLIVFLTEEFNVKSIDAAPIANVVHGSSSFFPIIGAIVADFLFGSFSVISISSCISLLGIIVLALTATLNSLRPQPCVVGSELCQPTSTLQDVVLYAGKALASIGLGCTRYTLATMGANQFDKPKYQATVALTVIVYIEDNAGWRWGFGLCVLTNIINIDKPQGSPFVALARVVVAAFRKRKLQLSSESKDYYDGHDGVKQGMVTGTLSTSFSIFLSTPLGVQSSMIVLQALSMDRHIGPHFEMPSGSVILIVLLSTAIFLTLIDRFLCLMWQKLTGRSPTFLQCIGLGHVLNVLSMALSALVDTSTAMISLVIGIAFYLSTGVTNLVQCVTRWLPNDINNGKLDNVYWMLVVVGVLNFGYYLVCGKLYKYQNVKDADVNSGSVDSEK